MRMLISLEAKQILCSVFPAQREDGSTEQKSIIRTPQDIDGINVDWNTYCEEGRRPLLLDLIFNRLHMVLDDVYLMYNIVAFGHLRNIVQILLHEAADATNQEGLPEVLKINLARHGAWAKNSLDLYMHIKTCVEVNEQTFYQKEEKNQNSQSWHDNQWVTIGGIVIGVALGGITVGGVAYVCFGTLTSILAGGGVGCVMGGIGGLKITPYVKNYLFPIEELKNIMQMRAEMQIEVTLTNSHARRRAGPKNQVENMILHNPDLYKIKPTVTTTEQPQGSLCIIL